MSAKAGRNESGWAPAACTLSTAERPTRVAEFGALFDAAVRVRRCDATRLRVVLEPTPEVAARCASLAARETACCSFFTFALTAAGGELWLEISVPAPRAGVLDGLLARAAR